MKFQLQSTVKFTHSMGSFPGLQVLNAYLAREERNKYKYLIQNFTQKGNFCFSASFPPPLQLLAHYIFWEGRGYLFFSGTCSYFRSDHLGNLSRSLPPLSPLGTHHKSQKPLTKGNAAHACTVGSQM